MHKLTEGTDLYHRTLDFDYGDDERRDLMKEVWSITPWMVDVYTGDINSKTERKIREWCYEHLGEAARPIHGKPGNWQFGSATIYGWTWYGFATETLIRQFLERFPQPDRRGLQDSRADAPNQTSHLPSSPV